MATVSPTGPDPLRKLLRRARREFRDAPSWGLTEIASWLHSSRTDRNALIAWMMDASGWYSSKGLARVLAADDGGWADLLAGNRWWLGADRLAAELVVSRECRHAAINPNHFALRITLASLFDDSVSDNAWATSMLRRGFAARSNLYVTTDSRMVAHTMSRVVDRDYSELDECGVYRPLVEAVRDRAPARPADVVAACDYHIDRATRTGRSSEFSEGPFAVLPVEMETFRRAGVLDELEPLEEFHPLFGSCPFRVPRLAEPLDAVLSQVRARAQLT